LKLHSAAAIEGFGNALERKIVDGRDHGTGRERRGGVLHMQHVHRPASQRRRQSEGDPHQRCVRQRLSDLKIWPSILKAIDGRAFGNEKGVLVGLIDFGESFD